MNLFCKNLSINFMGLFLREMSLFHRTSYFKIIISFHLIFTVKFPSVPTVACDQEDLASSPLGSPATASMVTAILMVVTTSVGFRDPLHHPPRAAEEESGRSG